MRADAFRWEAGLAQTVNDLQHHRVVGDRVGVPDGIDLDANDIALSKEVEDVMGRLLARKQMPGS